jgi:TRAP-type C4-dicarboxylate transport system substrate-binding protein
MKQTTRHVIALLAVALVGAVLAGCSSEEEGTKADGAKPVTLRIGTDDEPGKPASNQIEEFARRVEKLSGGAVRIKPVWHAAGDGADWDQRVARMVTSGKLDMGVIPSRSWDTEGVTSLRALNAPFLVNSDELLAEVLSGNLAGDLMSGLDKAGVVGLALFPEGLRHPFGLEKPLFGPDDYQGKAIRTATSNTTAAVFEALGASVNDEEADPRVHAGLDSSYFLDPGGTATGNVTFYPKVNSVVANAEAYEKLDDGQREILEKAAVQTRDWAIQSTPEDAQAAQTFCNQGGIVVRASEADIAALEEAAAPLYAELGRDEETGSLVAAIRELKQQAPATAAPAACGDKPETAGGQKTKALDGEYRFEITDRQLRDAGITDPSDIAENHGVYTVTLSDGEYCWEQKAPNPLDNPDECSTYELDGDRMIWRFPVGRPEVYGWRKTPTGDLELIVVRSAPEELPYAEVWTANSWKRIGDAK